MFNCRDFYSVRGGIFAFSEDTLKWKSIGGRMCDLTEGTWNGVREVCFNWRDLKQRERKDACFNWKDLCMKTVYEENCLFSMKGIQTEEECVLYLKELETVSEKECMFNWGDMKQCQGRNRVETHARRNTCQECLQGTCASEKRKLMKESLWLIYREI